MMRLWSPIVIVLSLLGCSLVPPVQIPDPSYAGQSAIVSDIDGTLTPALPSVYEVRPDAAQALRALSDKGYSIIYVTTRIPLFQSGLPHWLQDKGFPEGSLHVAQSSAERSDPEAFKANLLKEYVKRGWTLEYAFGDSSSDFAAYSEAGIPIERVYALKRRGSEDCLEGAYARCLDGWTEYLPYIDNEVARKN